MIVAQHEAADRGWVTRREIGNSYDSSRLSDFGRDVQDLVWWARGMGA